MRLYNNVQTECFYILNVSNSKYYERNHLFLTRVRRFDMGHRFFSADEGIRAAEEVGGVYLYGIRVVRIEFYSNDRTSDDSNQRSVCFYTAFLVGVMNNDILSFFFSRNLMPYFYIDYLVY